MNDLKYLIIDLDNTIYPESAGVFKRVDHLINRYLEEKMGFPKEEVNPLRLRYYKEYGTTLRGLMINYKIVPEDYLEYVHNINMKDLLSKDVKLNKILKSIPIEKVIFTNASKAHAENVLNTLGITDNFTHIFDIVAMDYLAKPYPETYKKLLNTLGVKGEQSLYIDDIEINLQPAKELGMRTVIVSNNGQEKKPYVDFVIKEVKEIGKVIAYS